MRISFIFDFFGVVCTNVGGDWFKEHFPGATFEVQQSHLRDADLGKKSEEDTFNAIATLIGGEGSALRENWLERSRVNKEMVLYIQKLKENHKIALCTNAPRDFFYTVLKKEGIENLFDTIIVSSEVGCMKPDPEIFRLTLASLGLEKEDVIFFDDTRKNVDAAEAFGIQSELFLTPKQLEKYIESK